MSIKDFTILAKLGIYLDKVGEGAYSTVYKVERLADSQIYALKKVKIGNLSEK
jgi:NIMA (never in mitosis gene a)-related kinase